MKRIFSTLFLGGALAAGVIATSGTASAACYDYESAPSTTLRIPTVCVGYDYCDADICVDLPWVQ